MCDAGPAARPVVVLLSGGMDSAVCAALAVSRGRPAIALVFDYGQRHRREIEAARAVASRLGLDIAEVAFDARAWGGSALTDESIDVPMGRDLDGAIPSTYVPARNLIFLSFGLAVAEVRGAEALAIGVNALDYSGYPDCRQEFLAAFAEAGRLALRRGVEGDPVRIEAPLQEMSKAEIVSLGIELGAPLELTWSCYLGDTRPCGACDSCRLRAKGFAEAGHEDPALTAGGGAGA